MPKYLVKSAQDDEQNEVLMICAMSDSRQKPIGNAYSMIPGENYNHPMAQRDGNGDIEIVNDEAKESSEDQEENNKITELSNLDAFIRDYKKADIKNIASVANHIDRIMKGMKRLRKSMT